MNSLLQRLRSWEQSLSRVDRSAQDAEEALRSELLGQLLVACSLALILYIVLGRERLIGTLLYPLGAVDLAFAIGAAFWLLRRKLVSRATVLLLVFLSHPIAFVIGGWGLETPAPALLLPTILICGLLVGRKLTATWTVICGAILLWDSLVRQEIDGRHLPLLAFWLSLYAVVGWLVALFSIHLERLLAATRAVEEAERSAVIAERTRMAREIHDNLAQGFTGIIVQINAAEEAMQRRPDHIRNHLDRAVALARQSLDEARLSVWALRSGEEDLLEQIKTIADRLLVGSEITLTTASSGSAYTLSPESHINLLRIAQEAIANSLKHARARRITVTLRYYPERVEMEIADDGIGFTLPTASGFGLKGMQERADLIGATLEIHTGREGTTLRIGVGR